MTESPHPKHRDTIVVMDYGSQYSQLITRRVRECQVYCEMLPWDASPEQIEALDPRGIILSGFAIVTSAPKDSERALLILRSLDRRS